MRDALIKATQDTIQLAFDTDDLELYEAAIRAFNEFEIDLNELVLSGDIVSMRTRLRDGVNRLIYVFQQIYSETVVNADHNWDSVNAILEKHKINTYQLVTHGRLDVKV